MQDLTTKIGDLRGHSSKAQQLLGMGSTTYKL